MSGHIIDTWTNLLVLMNVRSSSQWTYQFGFPVLCLGYAVVARVDDGRRQAGVCYVKNEFEHPEGGWIRNELLVRTFDPRGSTIVDHRTRKLGRFGTPQGAQSREGIQAGAIARVVAGESSDRCDIVSELSCKENHAT